MATILRHRDGTTTTTALTPEAVGHDLIIRSGGTGIAGKAGGDIYCKESVAANGDVTYRWNRFEPPAK